MLPPSVGAHHGNEVAIVDRARQVGSEALDDLEDGLLGAFLCISWSIAVVVGREVGLHISVVYIRGPHVLCTAESAWDVVIGLQTI